MVRRIVVEFLVDRAENAVEYREHQDAFSVRRESVCDRAQHRIVIFDVFNDVESRDDVVFAVRVDREALCELSVWNGFLSDLNCVRARVDTAFMPCLWKGLQDVSHRAAHVQDAGVIDACHGVLHDVGVVADFIGRVLGVVVPIRFVAGVVVRLIVKILVGLGLGFGGGHGNNVEPQIDRGTSLVTRIGNLTKDSQVLQ